LGLQENAKAQIRNFEAKTGGGEIDLPAAGPFKR